MLELGMNPSPFRHPDFTFLDCFQSRKRLAAVLFVGSVPATVRTLTLDEVDVCIGYRPVSQFPLAGSLDRDPSS